MKLNSLFIVAALIILLGCKDSSVKKSNTLNVVTTTTMITDIAENIGGDVITVQGLMGSGVDPHLYKASEGDVTKLANADIVFYNGLHLEGKLVEVFEKMGNSVKTVGLADVLDKNRLIGSEYFASSFDPHVWFNIDYFIKMTKKMTAELKALDPQHADTFETNSKTYIEKLKLLETDVLSVIEKLPKEKRILVTAHDAFNYFGEAYNFEVVGLQGLSTATEAGVQDVQNLAKFIIDNKVKAIFVESSVPKRTIEALQEAVKSKGFDVEIGGTLYSDALGNKGTEEGTYIGMFKYNVKTIVEALK